MSAAELREAAKVMRERAEVCLASDDQWYERAEMLEMLRSKDSDSNAQPFDAAHIASWHPAVALAVADWLDGVALYVEAKDDEEYFDLDGDPIAAEDTHAIGSALKVARAYLGPCTCGAPETYSLDCGEVVIHRRNGEPCYIAVQS